VKRFRALDRAATVIGGIKTAWRCTPEDSDFHNNLINQSKATETQKLVITERLVKIEMK
jgi:hypothetical protein